MQSVTEIQLKKLRAHFRARFAPMIWANCAPLNVWGGGDYYIGANQARIKRELSHIIYYICEYVSSVARVADN